MEINFGNLPMMRDSIPSIDQLCAWANGEQTNLPPFVTNVVQMRARSGLSQVASNFVYGTDKHSRNYNPIQRKIRVYHSTNYKNTRNMIMVPSTVGGSIQSSWRVYCINRATRQFENIGPKNGAIIDSHTIHGYKGNEVPSKCTNLRVDENGQLPNLIAGSRFTANRVYPDKNIHIQLQFSNWFELLNPNGTGNITTSRYGTRVGIWSLNSQSFPLLSVIEWKDRMGEDLQLDFTREGFPMSNFDLTAALLV